MKRKWAELLAAPVLVAVAMWPIAQSYRQRSSDSALKAQLLSAPLDMAKIEELVSHGANVNASIGGFSMLNVAVVGQALPSDVRGVRFLLQRGANPNVKNLNGETPLMTAVMRGYAEAVQLLIAYHANVNETDERDGDRSALDYVDLVGNKNTPDRKRIAAMLKAAGAKE